MEVPDSLGADVAARRPARAATVVDLLDDQEVMERGQSDPETKHPQKVTCYLWGHLEPPKHVRGTILRIPAWDAYLWGRKLFLPSSRV